jgi:hypothetical protein
MRSWVISCTLSAYLQAEFRTFQKGYIPDIFITLALFKDFLDFTFVLGRGVWGQLVWATLMKCGSEPIFWNFVTFVCIVLLLPFLPVMYIRYDL